MSVNFQGLGQANVPGGLLRGLTEQNIDSPTQQAAFDPASANLVQEPLSKQSPAGTSQIIANKPNLTLQEVQAVLHSMPVPSPEVASQLIAAMVSQPPAPRPAPKSAPRPVVNRTLGNQAVAGGSLAGGGNNILKALQAFLGLYGPANPNTGVIGGLSPFNSRSRIS